MKWEWIAYARKGDVADDAGWYDVGEWAFKGFANQAAVTRYQMTRSYQITTINNLTGHLDQVLFDAFEAELDREHYRKAKVRLWRDQIEVVLLFINDYTGKGYVLDLDFSELVHLTKLEWQALAYTRESDLDDHATALWGDRLFSVRRLKRGWGYKLTKAGERAAKEVRAKAERERKRAEKAAEFDRWMSESRAQTERLRRANELLDEGTEESRQEGLKLLAESSIPPLPAPPMHVEIKENDDA